MQGVTAGLPREGKRKLHLEISELKIYKEGRKLRPSNYVETNWSKFFSVKQVINGLYDLNELDNKALVLF